MQVDLPVPASGCQQRAVPREGTYLFNTMFLLEFLLVFGHDFLKEKKKKKETDQFCLCDPRDF